MMKTTMIIVSSVFFALGLAGCKEEAPKTDAPAVTETAPAPAPAAEPAK